MRRPDQNNANRETLPAGGTSTAAKVFGWALFGVFTVEVLWGIWGASGIALLLTIAMFAVPVIVARIIIGWWKPAVVKSFPETDQKQEKEKGGTSPEDDQDVQDLQEEPFGEIPGDKGYTSMDLGERMLWHSEE